ncbi:MAG TPA: CHASE2 domain-containing protein, partial [Acetobacteraceae bacterium]|nr:CHASE2 domain-containing protein [Acetobacteraceae bacterium]
MLHRRRFGEAVFAILIVIAATAAALILLRPPSPLAAAERLFQALAFRLLAPTAPAAPRVVIIGITEATLAGFPYSAPIDRGFLAGLVDQLARAGVAAVGLDVVFDRPTEPAKDAALRQALLRADAPVIAISLGPEAPEPPERRQFLRSFLDGALSGDANLARDRFDDMVRTHVPRDGATGQMSFPARIAAALGRAVPDHAFPILWQAQRPAVPTYPAE